MPSIQVTTWSDQSEEKWRERVETLNAPPDEITALIDTIPQERWGEGGVTGSRSESATLSRRQQ